MDSADRDVLIQSLRDLASLLATKSVVPSPSTGVVLTAVMPEGHSFLEVLNLCEAMSPCDVLPALDPDRRMVTKRFGRVTLNVLVDASAIGELRSVQRWVPEFFVDTEAIRYANAQRDNAGGGS